MTQATLDVSVHELGVDRLPVVFSRMTDMQVLQETAQEFPNGINVRAANRGPVYLNPAELLKLAHPDGFGLEAVGIANTAAEILRMAARPEIAKQLGSGCDLLLAQFTGQATARTRAKRVNQVQSTRIGTGAKVVCSDAVEPGTFEYNPDGLLGRTLAGRAGLSPDNLHGEYFLVVRHPFIGMAVLLAVPNYDLPEHVVQLNRNDHRTSNLGDCDGDTINLYYMTAWLAERVRKQLLAAVPDLDVHREIIGVDGHAREAGMCGENIFEDEKTVSKKLAFTKTMTVDDWLDAHIKMGDYANKFTPFAYRIADVCALMASAGMPGAETAALIGAVIEEVRYLGLAIDDDDEDLNIALETWMKQKLNSANLALVMNGLRGFVDRNILSTDVKTALITGSKINRNRFDEWDAASHLVKFGWLIGKGLTTVSAPGNPNPIGRLQRLAELAGSLDVDPDLRDTFLAKVGFFAARKLAQVVRPEKARHRSDDDQVWDDDGFEMDADEDVYDLIEE